MSPDIKVEVQIHLDLPEETHKTALEALLDHANKVGGSILYYSSIFTYEGSEDIPPYLISKTQFFENSSGTTSNSWLTRTWDAGLSVSNRIGREKATRGGTEFEDAEHTVDLNNILEYMRQVEKGERRVSSFAKTAWNIFGGLINRRFNQEGETIVLGWEDEIHKKFLITAADSTNQQGVSEISDLYALNLQRIFEY